MTIVGDDSESLLGGARNFKLNNYYDFVFKPVFLDLTIEPLRPVRSAFAQSVIRVKSPLMFWLFGINFCREIERYECITEMEFHGKINRQLRHSDASPEFAKRIDDLYGETLQNEMAEGETKKGELYVYAAGRVSPT